MGIGIAMILSFPSAGWLQPAESDSNCNSGIYKRRHRGLSHHRETMTLPGKIISPHCGKTLPVNKHRSKTLEPGLRRRSRRPLPAGRADSPDSLLAVDLPMPTSTRRSRMSFFSFFEAFAYSSLKRFVSLRLVAMSSLSSIGKHPRRAKPTGRDLVLVSSMTSKPKLHAQKIR